MPTSAARDSMRAVVAIGDALVVAASVAMPSDRVITPHRRPRATTHRDRRARLPRIRRAPRAPLRGDVGAGVDEAGRNRRVRDEAHCDHR